MLHIYSFLGTSGQNVDDILKYTDFDDPIVMAERCLFWRHIAPSAPDTLCMFFLFSIIFGSEKKHKNAKKVMLKKLNSYIFLYLL